MKLRITNFKLRLPGFVPATGARGFIRQARAFTLIEIAICLAIIGFALVAIIGVLPLGMNAQRANREETVINQDATVLINAIRNGAQGLDYLTNYLYAITNTVTYYNGAGVPGKPVSYGYNFNSADNNFRLTSGYRIIGLLSTPEYSQFELGGLPVSETFNTSYYSNHVVAYLRSISGLAAEKPPQDNQIMREDTFSYRLYCVNAPIPVNTNSPLHGFEKQLAANQRELRLTFLWPQLPNGKVGFGRQTYRTTIAGQLMWTNDPSFGPGWSAPSGQGLYFYQPQIFTNAP